MMKLTIKVPDEVFDNIELLTPEGQKVETFIEKRLNFLTKINPDRPWMYLNGDALAALSALYGGHVFTDSDDLVRTLKRTQTFRMAGTLDVTVDMDILTQLRLQADGMGVPFEKYFRDNINEALMFLCGVDIQGISIPGRTI